MSQRLAAAHADFEDDEVEITNVTATETTTAIVRRKTVVEELDQPNLFALLPDMVARFKQLTVGGKPLFDQFGNVAGDEEDPNDPSDEVARRRAGGTK